MQQDFPPEFKWLADLAAEVNELSGFYKHKETAAVYCPNCQVIQVYCTSCGEKLMDVYDETTNCCQNCGISLSHCHICSHELEEQTTAPDHTEKTEYWKYCPACGKPVFAVTDMCPSCHVSMGAHLDAVYAETVDRVSETTLIEERLQEGTGGKSKKSQAELPIPSFPANDESDWFFGKPYHFTAHLPIEDCIKALDQVTFDKRIQSPATKWSTSTKTYYSEIRYDGVKCYAIVTPAQKDIQELFVTSAVIWLINDGVKTEVIVNRSAPIIFYLFFMLAIIMSPVAFVLLPSIETIIGIIMLWVIIKIPVRAAFRKNKILLHIRQWLQDIQLED